MFLTFAPCSLLSLKEQRLRYLKQQEQRQQQQASEQEKLQRLRENIENQETRLKKVRALKGQVEQKRLSNGKLGKHMDINMKMQCLSVISCLHNTLIAFLNSLSSGRDRADEQPVSAEAERASDGCVQSG